MAKSVKKRIMVKPGTTTAKCPICQFPLDVTEQSEGTCPKCKNDVEIFFDSGMDETQGTTFKPIFCTI